MDLRWENGWDCFSFLRGLRLVVRARGKWKENVPQEAHAPATSLEVVPTHAKEQVVHSREKVPAPTPTLAMMVDAKQPPKALEALFWIAKETDVS